jgi:hypothetical protein
MKRLLRALVCLWVLLTAAVWLYVSAKALGDPGHSFGVGLVQTEGRNAVWVTLPAVAAALAGCILMWRERAAGAWLLLAYGLFWAVALAGGAAKDAYQHYRLASDEYSPSELMQMLVVQVVLGAFFFLVALWAWRNRTVNPLRSLRPLR